MAREDEVERSPAVLQLERDSWQIARCTRSWLAIEQMPNKWWFGGDPHQIGVAEREQDVMDAHE